MADGAKRKNTLSNAEAAADTLPARSSRRLDQAWPTLQLAMPVTETHNGGVTKKNAPGYWNSGQTWIGDITASVGCALSDLKRDAEENADGLKFWFVADAVTGATNSDFPDYFGLVQAAGGRLATQ